MTKQTRASLKLYILLVIMAVAMAFSLGYVTLFVQGSQNASSSDIARIKGLKEDFLHVHGPMYIINFNSLYFNRKHFQLLDPLFIISTESAHPGIEYSTDRDCFRNLPELLSRTDFHKVWIWEEFRCGKRFRLPRDFFSQAPFIHPSGKSYALLAFESGRKNYASRDWVISNLAYFHVLEFNRLYEKIGELPGHWSILRGLSFDNLISLASGQDHILTRDFFFSRVQYPDFYFIFEYRIFSRSALEAFLRDSPYYLHNYAPGQRCFYRDGGLCWDYNTRHLFSIINRGSFLFLVGITLIIILLIRLIWVKLKSQRLEDERRRLALQVLTHEFRTPISSMLLMMERAFKHIDELEDEMQEIILSLSSDVHRLQRLTETSRNYLRVQQKGKGLVSLSYEKVDDLNHFFEEMLYSFREKYGEDKIFFTPLPEGASFELDTYWVSICFKNLINNAIDHGAFPLKITLSIPTSDLLIVEVEDAGECLFHSLAEMEKEFVKGNKSEGTGLGLNIVKKVMTEMGGELKFRANPTCFSLYIKWAKDMNGGKNVKDSFS